MSNPSPSKPVLRDLVRLVTGGVLSTDFVIVWLADDLALVADSEGWFRLSGWGAGRKT